jgi:hypothetical protein
MDGSLRLSSGQAHQRRLLDLLPAVLLGVATFALYAKTLAPTVLVGDGGEFQFVPYVLGIAHPTGYPLYCLLGWAWSHLLSAGDVAYRMNLFSAFWAALAVGLLHPTARMLLRRSVPALPPPVHGLIAALAAASFAVTPTFWSQAIIAEVYSFHTVFVVLLFLLLLAWAERPSRRSLLLVALTFGLGLTHHRTTLLLFPAIVAYFWLSDRSVFRDRRLILGALPMLLLPLALYLYIPLRAPHTPYLHLPLSADRELILYENTLSGLVDSVLGGPFGSSVDLSVDLGERLAMAWGFLRDQVGWIGIGLALVGLAGLAVTHAHTPRSGRPVLAGEQGQDRQVQAGSGRGSRALLALTGLTYVTTVAFNLVYTIGDVFVLYIPSYLVVVLWLAAGVGFLAQIGHRLAGKRQWASALAVLSFLVLPLYMGISYYAKVDQSQNITARTGWEAILARPPPSGALLISNDRNEIMPMWYFQYVDGRRPDLLGLFPLITADYPSLGHVLDLALSTDRPIYLVKEMPGVGVKVRVETEGQLWQIIGPAVEEEPTYALGERLDDAVVLVGYDRSPHSPHPGGSLQISLYWEALRPLEATYHSFVHLLDAKGHKIAQSDQQPGGDYYPSTLWRRGERLRDDHTLTVPVDAPVGVYHLLVGMYALSADGTLEPLGEPVSFGQLEISRSFPSRYFAALRSASACAR